MDLSVLALAIVFTSKIDNSQHSNGLQVKKGDGEIPGLTDKSEPKRLGPKRATKIRRFFGLSKEDDVRRFVIRREVTGKDPSKVRCLPLLGIHSI